MEDSQSLSSLWPLLVYFGGVVLLVAVMLIIPYLIGERHSETATDTVYESGINVTGHARIKFPVHFYLVAMLFVIFDLEVIFIVAWAIGAKTLGWAGYTAIATFILSLVAVLVYIIRMGALDFGPSGKKILKRYHKIYNPGVNE